MWIRSQNLIIVSVYVHDVDVKIGYLTVGIPAAILIVGGIIWYRRRKK